MNKVQSAARGWLGPAWVQNLAIIGITGLTGASMIVWWRRKTTGDQPNKVEPPDVQGYGRKSAVATGTMEGDISFQGIFPAKKMGEIMAPILPAKQPDHPSQEHHPEQIRTKTPEVVRKD